MVQQVRLNWSVPGGGGGESALHFDDSAPEQTVRDGVQGFLTLLGPLLGVNVRVDAEGTIRQFDTATGTLTEERPFANPPNILGSGGGNQVPNAAQGLVRLGTSTVRAGRVVRGRIFIPGMHAGTMTSDGNVTPSAQTALSDAAAVLANNAAFGIWSRPRAGAGGVFANATGGSGWSEFAVQRRRRS